MTTEIQKINKDKATSKKKNINIQLTERDLEILSFCLEMKFADLATLHQKFFSNLKSGEPSKSYWWARERLALLKQHGFLETKRVAFTGVSFYLATEFAHRALASRLHERNFVQPITEIDIRTFEHDLRVLAARVALERLGRAARWVSERQLKADRTLTAGLERAYMPDGIYWNKRNEMMAFELELASKTQDRYADKISKYVDVIRQNETSRSGFMGVLFVVVHEPVFQRLSELTNRYEGRFRVEKYNELITTSNNLGVINGQ